MAKKNSKEYTIVVKSNPNFCGIGAGGVHFANGQAVILEGRLVDWFREHEGYEVAEKKDAAEKKDSEQ